MNISVAICRRCFQMQFLYLKLHVDQEIAFENILGTTEIKSSLLQMMALPDPIMTHFSVAYIPQQHQFVQHSVSKTIRWMSSTFSGSIRYNIMYRTLWLRLLDEILQVILYCTTNYLRHFKVCNATPLPTMPPSLTGCHVQTLKSPLTLFGWLLISIHIQQPVPLLPQLLRSTPVPPWHWMWAAYCTFSREQNGWF